MENLAGRRTALSDINGNLRFNGPIAVQVNDWKVDFYAR
jgi:hypothetical protein